MAEETSSTGKSLGHLGIPDTHSQDPTALRGAVLGFQADENEAEGEGGGTNRNLLLLGVG